MRVLVKSIDQHNSKNIEKAGCSVCVWMYMCCTEGKGQSRASCNGVCVCARALTNGVVRCRAFDLEQRYTVRVITGLMIIMMTMRHEDDNKKGS